MEKISNYCARQGTATGNSGYRSAGQGGRHSR